MQIKVNKMTNDCVPVMIRQLGKHDDILTQLGSMVDSDVYQYVHITFSVSMTTD